MEIASKDVERKVLAEMRKTVAALGEDSYIGTAFEGAWELAELNIEGDAAYSVKEIRDTRDKLYNARESERLEYEGKIRDLKFEIEEKEREIHELLNQKENCEAEYSKLVSMSAENEALKRRIEIKDEQIVKLKAKLYDILVEK